MTTRTPEALERDDAIARAMATPEFLQDPYPVYARMRRERPVCCGADGVWYVTRYADVEAAVRDLRFSNDRDRTTESLAAQAGDLERLSRFTRRLGRVMTNTDPPDHTRLRALVNKAFTARLVQDLRPRIQAVVDDLLAAAVAAGTTMDVVGALASPLPLTVIFELFGIPNDEQEGVLASSRDLGGLSSPEGFDRAERALQHLEDYLAELIGRRRAEPGADVVSALVLARDDDGHLSDEELHSACLVLLTAGDETTTNLIGNGILALLRHPDQLRRLRQEPTMIRPAVEELARYDTSSQVVSRVVVEDVEIAGETLCEGDLVYLVLGAANRDPERFVDPDRLDLGRSDKRHVSFGGGRHHCVGAPLSRLQAEIAIGTLVRGLPALHLGADAVEWRPNWMQRGPARLPVAY